MKKVSLISFILLSVSSAWAVDKPMEPVAVIINNAKGEQVGDLVLTQQKNGVKVHINLMNLPPGTYAAHFHEKGVCQGPDFRSAGDHFNPEKKKHGFDIKGGRNGHRYS